MPDYEIPEEQRRTYETLTQCSAAVGLDKNIIRAAKAHGCPGFHFHRIDWRVAGPWIYAHLDECEQWAEETFEEVRKQNLIKDGLIKDLEIQKRKKEYVDPKDVKEFLTSMATAQSAILKKIPKEVPAKCAGKTAGEIEAILEKAVREVFDLFSKELGKWMRQTKG